MAIWFICYSSSVNDAMIFSGNLRFFCIIVVVMSNHELAFFRSIGRISRLTFLLRYFWLSTFAVLDFTFLLCLTQKKEVFLLLLLLFFVFVIFIVAIFIQAIKRAHDIGKTGWITLIPFYNSILFFSRGDDEVNLYGNSPNLKIRYSSDIIFKQEIENKTPIFAITILGMGCFLISIVFFFVKINACIPKTMMMKPHVCFTAKHVDKSGSNKRTGSSRANFVQKERNIKAISLEALREKIKSITKGKRVDLQSFKLDLGTYSLNYLIGDDLVDGIALVFDPDKLNLNNRIIDEIAPRNLPSETVILIESEFATQDNVYCSIIAFKKFKKP
jgi:uncharacterized membrane protein YhaH (DUF805 family)